MKRPFSLVTRFGTNMRLAMVMLFAALTVVGMTPFAVMRALNGQWTVVALEVILMLGISINALLAWRTGNGAMAGSIIAILASVGFTALVTMVGPTLLFWAYVVIVANFMLAPRILATVASVMLVIASISWIPFPDTATTAAFAVSSTLVLLFAFIFASLSDLQRRLLEGLATRDPLTGIANRRSMEVELADALKGHNDRGEPAVVAVLDLDNFKLVNDQFGHDTGDRVIIAFTQRVQACIRKRDRLYRLGGEEFVLLLPDTDHSGARAALEKVRDAVQSEPLAEGLRVTTSIGAATLEPEDDWPRWLARADSALYHAKDAGRDRVSFDAGPSRPGERRLRLVSGRPLR